MTASNRSGLAIMVVSAAMALAGLHAPLAEAAAKKRAPGNTESKVYRWVDDQGVVHYGDAVPPEYAPADREVINQYGIPIRTEQGLTTDAEKAAIEKAEAERAAAIRAARRDEVLLSTYLSIEEIEALRNRRVELIDGQISVTQNYLASLQDKLKRLQDEASTYKPYSPDPEAEQIDEKLAQELTDTLDSIALYEKTLTDTRSRQHRLVAEFDADIARFRELKGL